MPAACFGPLRPLRLVASAASAASAVFVYVKQLTPPTLRVGGVGF